MPMLSDLPMLLAVAPVEYDFSRLLIMLVAVLVAAKLLGDLAQRLGQPAVLGELVAGIALGPSLLGLVDPTDPALFAMAELGLLILLFEIGLHTDVRSIVKVGGPALAAGAAGIVLPFFGGLAALRLLNVTGIPALVAGAALTATSIGISARVLADLDVLNSPEGQVVLGAAVLDDVIGLIMLSVVSGVAAGGSLTAAGVSRTTAVAIGFLVVALLVGFRTAAPFARAVSRLRVAGALGALSLAFALTFSAAAQWAGSAMIVGAFAAGLVLHDTPPRVAIEHSITRFGHFFVPIFFASVGAQINIRTLLEPQVLLIGGVLCTVAILGKLLAGLAPVWLRANRLLIGVAMIPRGEVGLIFAQMGIATGALDEGLFSAVVLMVMVTTFVAPPWLARLVGTRPVPHLDGSVGDLVAGDRR